MPTFSISDFRNAIGAPTAVSPTEYITVDNDKLAGVTSQPANLEQVQKVRTALFDSLKPLGQGNTAFESTLQRLIYGESGELKNVALTKLQARNIIDHAEAVSGQLMRNLSNTLLTGSFPKPVLRMLQRTVIDQSSNPVVRAYLAEDRSSLEDLGRVASLAKLVFADAKGLSAEDRYAIAYLDGFATQMGTVEKEKVDSNPLASDADKMEIEEKGFGDGKDFAAKQQVARSELKAKIFSGESSTDEFKAMLDRIAKPKAEDGSDKSQSGEVNKQAVSVKMKETDPEESKFDQVPNTGKGNNCLFYSMAHLLLGKEKTTPTVAHQMRVLCTEFAESLKADPKGWKALEEDSSLSLMLQDADFGGLKPNSKTKTTQQVDLACVQMLAHLTRRPITVITTDADTQEKSVQTFDLDLKTGKKLIEKEDEAAGQMLYLHYDMHVNRQEKTTVENKDPKDVSQESNTTQANDKTGDKDKVESTEKKVETEEGEEKPVPVTAGGHFTALIKTA